MICARDNAQDEGPDNVTDLLSGWFQNWLRIEPGIFSKSGNRTAIAGMTSAVPFRGCRCLDGLRRGNPTLFRSRLCPSVTITAVARRLSTPPVRPSRPPRHLGDGQQFSKCARGRGRRKASPSARQLLPPRTKPRRGLPSATISPGERQRVGLGPIPLHVGPPRSVSYLIKCVALGHMNGAGAY